MVIAKQQGRSDGRPATGELYFGMIWCPLPTSSSPNRPTSVGSPYRALEDQATWNLRNRACHYLLKSLTLMELAPCIEIYLLQGQILSCLGIEPTAVPEMGFAGRETAKTCYRAIGIGWTLRFLYRPLFKTNGWRSHLKQARD